MAEENIETFWMTCEEDLKKYTAEFNNKIGVVGFHIEYKVLEKNSVGVIYGITMNYKDLMLDHGDVLFVQCMLLKKL